MKNIEGKYDPSFTFRSAKKAIAEVREYGSKIYKNRDTWVETSKEEFAKAAARHLDWIFDGSEFDKESELHHMFHVLCNAMFYIEHLEREKNNE